MTVLNNNFNGGPDTATLGTANSGQFGDNAFDVTGNPVASTVQQFIDANRAGLNRPTSTFVYGQSTGASADNPYVQWDAAMGNQTTTYMRFYIYVTSTAGLTADQTVFGIGSNSILNDQLQINLRTSSAPVLWVLKNFNSGTQSLGAITVATGQWTRIEIAFTASGSVGSATANFFAGADVDTTTVTDTISVSNQNYGTSTASWWYCGFQNSSVANVPTIYYANWQLNNTGNPGPAPWRYKGSPGILTNAVAPHDAIC
jgi:hypothetical protein